MCGAGLFASIFFVSQKMIFAAIPNPKASNIGRRRNLSMLALNDLDKLELFSEYL